VAAAVVVVVALVRLAATAETAAPPLLVHRLPPLEELALAATTDRRGLAVRAAQAQLLLFGVNPEVAGWALRPPTTQRAALAAALAAAPLELT
jgi:hypothetical protein